MKETLTEKILKAHTVDKDGEYIGLKIDQTLTQDATGTLAYLEFEAMGKPRVETELSVAYVDHNTLQNGFMNADDHAYIKSAANKFGLYYSRPGNGICHQVHLERFGIPGKTLAGSDSHTPTGGGIGMLAFGAGGMDVAAAMAGAPYYIKKPQVVKVEVTGKLNPFVSAKDIALELLRRISVKGGVGKVMEWAGPGLKNLSVPERATITNMGTELGATTSIFPSDDVTYEFMKAQGREADWVEIKADEGAEYKEVIKIDLDTLEPMAARPDSPDNVCKISEIEGTKVTQVCIGSCTNSSLLDMYKTAEILKGETVKDTVSLTISPGSKQVLSMLTRSGRLADIVDSGARLLECACGPCIGMGQSPGTGGVSLRTFNRNFLGRSGTKDAGVYLVSPEVAAAAAIVGEIIDPRKLPEILNRQIAMPKTPNAFDINDNGIEEPLKIEEAEKVTIKRGPNIKEFPKTEKLSGSIEGEITLKVGDNITTDHIMPAGARVLPYRSNIPKMSEFCFDVVDGEFPARCLEKESCIIIGGDNYGQGSSREHAAIVPMYLGVKVVIAKSFARIHKANLVNAGILPLEFVDAKDYENLSLSDVMVFDDLYECLEKGEFTAKVGDKKIELKGAFSEREKAILRSGSLLNFAAGTKK